MKLMSKLAMLLLSVVVFGFTACSEDDSSGRSGEYLEVTVNGKTFKKVIECTGVSETSDYSCVYTCDTDPIDFMLWFTSDLNAVASASPGSYRLNSSDYPQCFDLDIEYITDDYDFIPVQRGTHNVTSIRKVGQGVMVEGKFSGVLENGAPISGKYRIWLWLW